ncbi:MAG: hypothetical protein UY48_C0008G0042 [Candidatus Gottesmanbacteria bacterium GW2011_GWB1_49_7]|uniref:Ribbon-helix-helix protein CopG domain-containing protein n=1 Tax=Candidatus Gottesmanbacteria bacterium GW2011_GWB1_49_7 TaxID=1618448 RepID=A0A0G1YD25_9BACT|nr:MAG: hypothetical protein UY48_C0008G0042 [Candidatus Gottesmanbacteria bacterium GW2011_GWB1_49_7]
MNRKPTSFTLTEHCRGLLVMLSHKLGISQAAIVELAIREKAERETPPPLADERDQLIDGQHRIKATLAETK